MKKQDRYAPPLVDTVWTAETHRWFLHLSHYVSQVDHLCPDVCGQMRPRLPWQVVLSDQIMMRLGGRSNVFSAVHLHVNTRCKHGLNDDFEQ